MSDYTNSYEAWNDQSSELERRNETRVINMVFAYDEQFGALDTYNLGGVNISIVLQKMFCNAVLGYELIDKQVLKSAFEIDHLKHRQNKPMALPHIGITRAWILCLEFDYQDNGKRKSHRMSISDSGNDDEIYDILEHDINRDNIALDAVSVRFVRINLTIELNGIKRNMAIELRKNSCTLKSNADDLRKVGELFIKENGIDVQLSLF